MFENLIGDWSFLVGEIWFILVAAGLVGLISGWVLRAIIAWGLKGKLRQANERVHEKEDQIAVLETDILKLKTRYNEGFGEVQEKLSISAQSEAKLQQRLSEIDDVHAEEIEALRLSVADRDRRILDLETKTPEPASGMQQQRVRISKRRSALPEQAVIDAAQQRQKRTSKVVPLQAAGLNEAPRPFEAREDTTPHHPEGGRAPIALDGPRNGVADDLKQINGVGPRLEEACNALGIYHLDQIAALSEDEVSWLDQNLGDFKGYVTRDQWVSQAKDMVGSDERADGENRESKEELDPVAILMDKWQDG